MPRTAPTRLSRVTSTLRTGFAPSRLLLAVKTAGAAAIAWYVAPIIPFTADEYSYYAPLGVVVSMYPTIAGSARSGLQTLAGLALGIGLGLVAVQASALGLLPGIALAITVLVGVLASGFWGLGSGREWVTMAALFVLLIGGTTDPETFSVSYIVAMAFGVVVGIVVNVVVVPPLYLRHAGDRLSALRDSLAEQLGEMADAVSQGAIDEESLTSAMETLADMLGEVAEDVREADLSRRGNPRGRRHAPDTERNAKRLRALERVTFFTRDLADLLARMPVDDPALQGSRSEGLSNAILACRDLIATAPGAEESTRRLEAATTAVEAYLSSLDPDMANLAETATAGVCLRRIVDASRPFVGAAA